MFVALAAIVSTASAQKLGVWYGLGLNHITADKVNSPVLSFESKSRVSAVNFGVNYTQEMGDFDVIGGLSYRQKGTKYNLNISSLQFDGDAKWKPGYIQMDVLGAYNFIKTDDLKFGIQTGPYFAVMVNKDKDNDGYATILKASGEPEVKYNSFDCGWQVGLAAKYLGVTLSAGYEMGFIKVYKDADNKCKNSDIYVKIGYEFDL